MRAVSDQHELVDTLQHQVSMCVCGEGEGERRGAGGWGRLVGLGEGVRAGGDWGCVVFHDSYRRGARGERLVGMLGAGGAD